MYLTIGGTQVIVFSSKTYELLQRVKGWKSSPKPPKIGNDPA